MWVRRIRGNLEELRRECVEAARQEEEASFALTRSARAFSHQTREVAEDKLSFSATLMRAGQVGAASRLIWEFEADVKAGEAALIEQMNEIEVARANRRSKVTRLRLVRTMAAAMLGACVMAFSAAGFALAGFVADLRESGRPVAAASGIESSGTGGVRAVPGEAGARSVKRVRLPNGRRLALNQVQYERFRRLTSSGGDSAGLEQFLAGLVGPELAARLTQTIASAGDTVRAVAEASADAAPLDVEAVAKAKKKSSKVKKKAKDKTQDEAKKPEPDPEPTPAEDEQPTPDPTDTGGGDGGPNSVLPTEGPVGG